MEVLPRFLNYIKLPTKSDEKSGTHPSSIGQMAFSKRLAEEIRRLGIADVTLTKKGYVYAKIPATPGCEGKKKIGFIAHVDTSPDFSGEDIHPQIIENYEGCDVPLGQSGRVLSPMSFPHLTGWKGRTLITTDGTTLLGADDKAGVAEIVTLAEKLISERIPHGAVRLAFTPDEEIGRGADDFDVGLLDADFAYTVDGDLEGRLEYENFNAASAVFSIKGVNVHPGTAKGIMVNAALLAGEIISMLPPCETPAETENYEGFYHLSGMTGNVETAEISLIVRDHDETKFANRLAFLRDLKNVMAKKYGDGFVTLTIKEQYRNMKEKIEPHRHLIENAERAAKMNGVTPHIAPIRGGTDGARLSFMGLPCPNLGTGGFAFHGPFEHITKEGMEKTVDILVSIVSLYAE